MNTTTTLLNQALAKHQAGDLKEAETLYRQALKQKLPDADALRCTLHLGSLLEQAGKAKQAVGVYNAALRTHPDSIELLNALGILQAQTGKLDQAATCFQKTMALAPGDAGSAFNLAKIYAQQNKLADAEHFYRQALQWQPDMVLAYNNLGHIFVQQNKHPEALSCFQKAVSLKPDYAPAYNSMGKTLTLLGKQREAAASFQQAITYQPNEPDNYYQLGKLLRDMEKGQDAIRFYCKAIELKPDWANAYIELGNILVIFGKNEEAVKLYQQALLNNIDNKLIRVNLGNSLVRLEQYESATEQFEKAIKFDPTYMLAHINLCANLHNRGLFSEAVVRLKHVLKIEPNSYLAHQMYGVILRKQSHYEEAIAHYEEALRINPKFVDTHNNLLFAISYHVLRSPEETLKYHQEWDKQLSVPKKDRYSHTGQGDANKRLRIGYVSPDFVNHSVSYFIEPILANHDHDKVEIYCYAEVSITDNMTTRLQSLADHWCFTVGMSDAQLAQRIHDDQIDILIDLAGHTDKNRLVAFTYKPAPVQATYLGYFTGTGLKTMDYWISDAILTPDDTVEQTVETIYNLDRCCLNYTPPVDAPEVTPLQQSDNITFGSFNDISKVSDDAVGLWSEVLKATPASRLILKAKQFTDTDVQKGLLDKFSSHGITSDRIEMILPTLSQKDHLELYRKVDIALDTIPRTGGATTMEALWMGVPVITLAGARFIERLSASMINALGHDEWIASDKKDYVEKAVTLASNRTHLTPLRQSLRDNIKASPLCNGRDLANSIEKAYRDMWQLYIV